MQKIDNSNKEKRRINKLGTIMPTIILSLVVATPYMTSHVEAVHGTSNDGTQIANTYWSRATSDGHRNELTCDTTYPDRCKIPFFLHSSLDAIKGTLTFSQIANEAFIAADYLGTATVKIGLLSQPYSSIWDNQVLGKTLNPNEYARYDAVKKHCTDIFCGGNDRHLFRVEVWVSTYQGADMEPFQATEVCQNGNVTQLDIEKTFKHEFNHVMGFTHSLEDGSILENGYSCDPQGRYFTAHDRQAIIDKYP